MERTFETFEFIAPNSPRNAEISPLFVLQEDGTILSMNRDIQYVAQTEDGKENIEPCTMFDVSSQRYYVDGNGATELITVPDQYVTQTDEDNVNSYLIQPESSAITEQMETDATIDSNAETLETDVDITTITTKGIQTGFTEITLSDDQYQLLEQKGWILLECYDKIFVLNTLGLHDITENEKLVAKLKTEVQALNVNTHLEQLTEHVDVKMEEQTPRLPEIETKELEKYEQSQNNDTQQLEIQSVIEDNTNENPVGLDVDEKMVIGEQNEETDSKDSSEGTQSIKDDCNKDEGTSSPAPEEAENEICNTIKIKTKYIFTDIPSKIYIGKTATGKKLYAKMTKSKLNRIKNSKNVVYEKKIENHCTLTESQFIGIVQDSLRSSPHTDHVNIIQAQAMIGQLMKISQIKEAIVGHKVIVTKILISTDEQGKTINQQRPIVITGIVNQTDDGKGMFINVPKMLQDLPNPAENKSKRQQMGSESCDKTNHMINIFHIHIAESITNNKVPNQTIQITKRKLSLNVLKDAKKRHPDPEYACGACAAVFKSEMTLKDHQENKCFADDALTIDTDRINMLSESYSTIEMGKKKLYSCSQCEAKFTRLFNCQKHVKTHDIPDQNPDSDDKNTDKEVYKCSMCPSTYFHKSSLSKHIVKMHVRG